MNGVYPAFVDVFEALSADGFGLGGPAPAAGLGGAGDRGERLRRALGLALRRLNRRELTTLEVRRHLERNEVDATTIDAALHELHASGFVDDSRFARLFTADRQRLDGWGADRIRRTLLGRGVDADVIDAALVEADADPDGESELHRALGVLRRRFPVPPTERRDRDRALGVLVRRGYDGDLALDAIAAYARDAR